MSMARVSLFGPTIVTSSERLGFRPLHGFGTGYTSLSCRASSGGSRRDYEKILARQQKRRVRHMKGVTPSTPDLIKTLDSEKRDQAKLDQEENHDKEPEITTLPPLDEPVVVTEATEVEDDQSSAETI